MKFPEKGLSEQAVTEKLEAFRTDDVDWRSGRTWGYIYDPGKEAEEIGKKAYMMYLTENTLDPTGPPFKKLFNRRGDFHHVSFRSLATLISLPPGYPSFPCFAWERGDSPSHSMFSKSMIPPLKM